MNSRKIVWEQTRIVLVGEIVCTAAMIGIFALLDKLDGSVILGGVVGAILAVANFFVMAMSATAAADKAQQQDVKGGQALVQIGYIVRMICLFGLMVLCAVTKVFNLLALVLPLLFATPILTVSEIFRKKGGKQP